MSVSVWPRGSVRQTLKIVIVIYIIIKSGLIPGNPIWTQLSLLPVRSVINLRTISLSLSPCIISLSSPQLRLPPPWSLPDCFGLHYFPFPERFGSQQLAYTWRLANASLCSSPSCLPNWALDFLKITVCVLGGVCTTHGALSGLGIQYTCFMTKWLTSCTAGLKSYSLDSFQELLGKCHPSTGLQDCMMHLGSPFLLLLTST